MAEKSLEYKITPEDLDRLPTEERKRVLDLLNLNESIKNPENKTTQAVSTPESLTKAEGAKLPSLEHKPEDSLVGSPEKSIRDGSENLTEDQRKEILSKILQGEIQINDPSDLTDLITGK